MESEESAIVKVRHGWLASMSIFCCCCGEIKRGSRCKAEEPPAQRQGPEKRKSAGSHTPTPTFQSMSKVQLCLFGPIYIGIVQ